MFLIIWCFVVIPLVSVVDGGMVAAVVSGALGVDPHVGITIGASLTAVILYGQQIYYAIQK